MKSMFFASALMVLAAFGLSGCYTTFVSPAPSPVPPPAKNERYRRRRRNYQFRTQMPGYVSAPQIYVQPNVQPYGQSYNQPYGQPYVPYGQPPIVTQTVPGYVSPPRQQGYAAPAQQARAQGHFPAAAPPPQKAPPARRRR